MKTYLWFYVFLAAQINLLAHARSGVESVQLDYIALDASVECNRILFQSSQHFKRTIFAVPRIVPGNGVESARNYNLTPTNRQGIYDLAISLYFPSNDELVKTGGASTFKKDLMACNWDKVKYDLNRNIKDPELQIQRVTPIPLTSIEMRIPGIQALGLIGRSVETNEEADILDYNGKSLTIHFEVTEAEKNIFQSQLVSAEGISTNVKFRFQARSRNGSVHAKIDSGNLAANFSAAVSAKGLKYLSSADLSATLKGSVTEQSVQISSEAGSEDLGKITNMLVEKIMKEVGFSMNQIQLNESDRAKAGSGQISVAAVVEILKTKMSSEVSFNLVSAPETATAQTEVKLKTDRINDPNSIEVKLSAGYNDPSLGINLKAGETIAITPAYWYTDVFKYTEEREYLTSSEINLLKLGNYFENITNENMVIKDISVNGVLLAQGEKKVMGIPNTYKYRWARVRKLPTKLRKESNIIPPSLESLKNLKVYMTFSGLGDSQLVQLAEFITMPENPFWKALYEPQTGRLLLTAKKDLGNIRFRERMRGKDNLTYESKPVILDQVFEQRTNLFGNSSYIGDQILKEDSQAISLQKSVVLYITRPRVMKPSEFRHILQAIEFLNVKTEDQRINTEHLVKKR